MAKDSQKGLHEGLQEGLQKGLLDPKEFEHLSNRKLTNPAPPVFPSSRPSAAVAFVLFLPSGWKMAPMEKHFGLGLMQRAGSDSLQVRSFPYSIAVGPGITPGVRSQQGIR